MLLAYMVETITIPFKWTRKRNHKVKRQAQLSRNIDHNVVDLYCGAGGLSLGAARAGFNVSCGVEIDPEAIKTHQVNFPKTIHYQQDVSKLNGINLRIELGIREGRLAGIIGGPPCQGFSSIGKNNADDPRNSLFVDMFRVVSEARPKFFLVENVPGILNAKNLRIRENALAYVENDYCLLPPMTFCAKDFGAPTVRTRVFFIGYLRDEVGALSRDDFAPTLDSETVHVREALKGLPEKINPNWQKAEQGWRIVGVHGNGFFASRLSGHVPNNVGDPKALELLSNSSRASGCLGTRHTSEVAKRYAEIKPGKRDPVSKSYRLDPDGFCPTIRAGTGKDRGSFQAVRPLHPTENRVITPREAARLQGFPDWFQFSPTKWHSFRQIGNSVSPILAEHLLGVIRKAMDDKHNWKE